MLLTACSRERSDDFAMTTNSPGAETPVQAMPVDPVGIRPIPSIPAALRGCWDAVPNEDPDEPGGGPMRLIIGATTIQQSFGKGEAITATADFIEQVSARSRQIGRHDSRHLASARA